MSGSSSRIKRGGGGPGARLNGANKRASSGNSRIKRGGGPGAAATADCRVDWQ